MLTCVNSGQAVVIAEITRGLQEEAARQLEVEAKRAAEPTNATSEGFWNQPRAMQERSERKKTSATAMRRMYQPFA